MRKRSGNGTSFTLDEYRCGLVKWYEKDVWGENGYEIRSLDKNIAQTYKIELHTKRSNKRHEK